MAYKNIIGATIAIGLDAEKSIDLIDKGLDKVSKELQTSFKPETFKIISLDDKSIKFQIRDIKNTVFTFQKELAKLGSGFEIKTDMVVSTDALDKTNATLIKTSNALDKVKDKFANLDNGADAMKYQSLSDNINKVQREIADIAISEENLSNDRARQLNQHLIDVQREVQSYQNLQAEVEKTAKYQSSLTQKFGDDKGKNVKLTGDTDTDINAVTQAMNLQKTEFKEAKTVYDSAGNAWTKFSYQVKQGDGVVKKVTATVNKANGEIRENEMVTRNANIQTTKWVDRLKSKFKELTTYMSASAIIFAFFNEFSKGITIVKNIDSAMTDLRKVTDETDATYSKFLETASKTGTAIGKSIPDVILATAEFSKLGYALDEASSLAEKALILTNIGDGINLEDSTGAITSAMKGFELDKTAEDVEVNSQRIIDAINEVSNKYAVSVTDISGAISRMSAVMNQTGTSLEQTMGMFTAGQEIIQDDSKVANGLLTIAQRLRGISEEGEDLSNLQPTLEKQFNAMGLTLLNQNGELKSTYEILNDLNGVWDDQSSQMQQYIGELIAGKRQISVLYSTLQNWENAQNATTTALQSNNSAIIENAKYLDSIQGKTEQFNVALQSLWNSTISSETVKSFIELGTSLVKVIDNFGLLKIILAGVTTYLIMNSNALKTVFNGARTAGFSLKSLATEFQKLGVKALFAETATKAFMSALTLIGSYVVMLAFQGIIDTISDYAHEAENARQASIGLSQEFEEEQNSLQKQVGLYKEYTEKLNTANLSVSESKEIKSQLIEIQNSLIKTYGDEFTNIDLINGKYEEQLRLLSDISKSKANEFIESNTDTFADAKKALNKERDYSIGRIGSSLDNGGGLLDFFNNYDNDAVKLLDKTSTGHGQSTTEYSVMVSANVEDADATLHQLYKDLEEFGKANNIDVSKQLEGISAQLKNTWTEELTEYKTVFDEYVKAQVIASDTLRPLYQESIQAIEDYNNALASGDNVEIFKTKDKLDVVQEKVADATKAVEGSQVVFDEMFSTISKGSTSSGVAIETLAQQSTTSLKDALKTLAKHGKFVSDIEDEYKELGTISSNSLYEIADAYPVLEQAVSDFSAEKITEKELIAQLKTAYQDDVTAYNQAIISKQGLDTNFFNKLKQNISDDIKQKAEAYGIDLDNYTNLQEAKLKLDAIYQQKLATLKRKQLEADKALSMSGQEGFEETLLATNPLMVAEQELDSYESFVSEFDTTITTTFKGYQAEAGKAEKSTSDFADTIDWTTEKIKGLERELDNLNDKLSHADTLEEQNAIYDKLISKQKEYIKSLKTTKKAQETAFNKELKDLSKKDQEKVKNGEYTVEQFKGKGKNSAEEKRFKEIRQALEAKDNLGETDDKLTQAEYGLTDLQEGKINNAYSKQKETLENELSLIQNSKSDILNGINEIEALGGQATEQQYKDLISNSEQEIANIEQQRQLAVDNLKLVDKSSPEYNKLQNDIQSCDDTIADARKSQLEWNKAIIELPIHDLERANNEYEKSIKLLNDQKDKYDKVISAVTTGIDDEIEAINKSKDAVNDEDIIGSYANRIKIIKDEVEALQEVNEQHKKEMELQQAQYNAERARNQKTKMVYREGLGMVYEADSDAIREAQNTIDELTFDSVIDSKEKVIKSLEKDKEKALKGFDKQIEKLEAIKKQWTDIAGVFEKLANIKLADEMFGSGWYNKIVTGDTKLYNDMWGKYTAVDGQIFDFEEKIKANEKEIQAVKDLSQAWQDAQVAIVKARQDVENSVKNNQSELDALSKADEATTAYATEWVTTKDSITGSNALIEENHTLSRDNELNIINQRAENLRNFAKEVSNISSDIAGSLKAILADLDTARSAKSEITKTTNKSGIKVGNPTITGDINGATHMHSGMELGYVGDSTSSKDTFRYIALDKLKPNELVKVLQRDEAVMTKVQQSNVLANLQSAFQGGANSIVSKMLNNSAPMQPSFSIGEIHLHEIDNVNGLADAIIKEFLPTMNQKIYR